MAFNVKCLIKREVYVNYVSEFRVLGCHPMGNYPELITNKYGDFTISGDNLFGLRVNEFAEITIALDPNAKYPASYKLVGFVGLGVENQEIVVDEDKEVAILTTMMKQVQAQRVHEAYPHFIQMVLNGEEGEIDHRKIYNVGEVRIKEYIEKVKNNLSNILFVPTCADFGITSDGDISMLTNRYKTPEMLQSVYNENPYHVYCDALCWSFVKADKMTKQIKPELIDSKIRCEYACVDILKQNELEGDTRIEGEVLFYMAQEVVPEASAYLDEVVNGCESVYHDEATGYSSLRTTYEAEKLIAEHIKDRLKLQDNIFLNNNIVGKPDFERFREIDGFKCTDEQMKILHDVWDYNVAILTGSGGSGKTSSTKALIRMLESIGIEYLLLTPTGISAKRLAESTGRSASTIHRFIMSGGNREKECDDNQDSCINFKGVVLIDECTMCSVDVVAWLLKRIGYGCKLVFVCDPAQLASIQCGNFITDLINSNVAPISRLTKVFRYGVGGIATMATDVRNGNIQHIDETYDDFKFVQISDTPIKQVVEEYSALLDKGYTKDEIMVLSPFNKGNAGTYAINEAIQDKFNDGEFTGVEYERDHKTIRFNMGDKVINIHNNYNMTAMQLNDDGVFEPSVPISVMNGDIGYVRDVMECDKGLALIVEFDSGYGVYSGSDLKNLILAYCISCHKSQGSQSKAVISLFDASHRRMLTRNIMYVAMSRAQKHLTVIGDKNVISDALAIQEETTRDTWLKDMLKED